MDRQCGGGGLDLRGVKAVHLLPELFDLARGLAARLELPDRLTLCQRPAVNFPLHDPCRQQRQAQGARARSVSSISSSGLAEVRVITATAGTLFARSKLRVSWVAATSRIGGCTGTSARWS